MTTEEGERARSEGADVDAPLSPKEGMELPVRNMSATNAAGGTFGLGIDQFELPKASVTKVARTDIPDHMQLRKDTITALVKSASVFVSYLTAASHDVAIARGNKTISAGNVMDAVRELDFPVSIRRELRMQLDAYRDLQKQHAAARATAAAQSRERARAARAAASAAAEAEFKADDAEADEVPAPDSGDGDMDVDASFAEQSAAEAALAKGTPDGPDAMATEP